MSFVWHASREQYTRSDLPSSRDASTWVVLFVHRDTRIYVTRIRIRIVYVCSTHTHTHTHVRRHVTHTPLGALISHRIPCRGAVRVMGLFPGDRPCARGT